jgi:GDSL-like Lipase/Acylhydrolase family
MPECFWRRQVYAHHDLIGWWHVPKLYARIPLGGTFHNVTTNSVGMRSTRDYPLDTPRGRRRIAFLGDSYTAGDGVSNAQRFTDLLEARYPQLDAMNFGLNGTGTDQQLLIYETLASHYSADAYVFCICVENIARNLYTCFPSFDTREHLVVFRPKPYFELSGDELVLHNQPVPLEKRSKDALGDWRYAFPYLPESEDPYAIYSYPDRPHWRTMKAILRRFIKGVNGKPVFVVPLPMYNHYLEQHPPTYWPRFRELADDSAGVFVVDLLPAFTRRPLSGRTSFRYSDDPHYTTAAHAVVASEIERVLQERCPGLLDAPGRASDRASGRSAVPTP